LEILDISTYFSTWEAGDKKVFPSYEFFTWFDGCSKLRELYFEGYKIDDFEFGFLDDRDDVGEISKYFGGGFWDLIEKFSKVEHLSFSGNQFTKIPEWFRFPKSLKSLKISSSHVSALFLDKLNDLPDFELLVGVDINGMYDPAFPIDGRK
jgi:Leucine-rich repeat (LRR) protein